MSKSAKVLVLGPACGQLRAYFDKANAINTKNGPFDMIIAMGDLFAPSGDEDPQDLQDLLSGQISISAPTLFSFGNQPLSLSVRTRINENMGELCPNLSFLGKSSTLNTADGLRIASFGGDFDLEAYDIPEASDPLSSPFFSASSIATLESSITHAKPGQLPSPVDILLTSSFPSQILNHSDRPPPNSSLASWGVPAISSLAFTAKPRYHFCAASSRNAFYEREPFTWPSSPTDPEAHNRVTRFISLGAFNNTEKQRWFYAFNMAAQPKNTALPPPPANVTQCPYDQVHIGENGSKGVKRGNEDGTDGNYIFGNGAKRSRANGQEPPPNYVCKICQVPGHFIQDCPEKLEKAQRSQHRGKGKRNHGPLPELTPDTCWFCLSNPALDKHLIASIGTETYLALPKGQIVDPSNSLVPGGGHVLIVPIAHYPTLSSIPGELAPPILEEIEGYKTALKKCYESKGAKMVTYEVARTTGRGGHAHVQICPVPSKLADKAEAYFKAEGQSAGLHFIEDPEQIASALQNPTNSYFKVELPNGKALLHSIESGEPFNLQFGRLVLAKLLDMPEREDWKLCAVDEEGEIAECQAFKEGFKAFDPNAM